MTFGEFLKQVLANRDLSITKLAKLMGIKSNTTIVRLLHNESSMKSIERFARTLSDTIDLTDAEQTELHHILRGTTVSPAESRTMENLKLLFHDVQNVSGNNICTAYNAEEKTEKMPLSLLFSVCKDKDSTIIIEDVANLELIYALNSLIHQTAKAGFSPNISHFFRVDEGIEAKGMQLMAIMKLSTYLSYNAYECNRKSVLKKEIVILTKDNGGYHMRLARFTDANKFHYVDTEISPPLYQHILYERALQTRNATPLKGTPMNSNQLADMILNLKEVDKFPSLQINSSLSYMMIPFHIQCRLFEEADYLGMGKDQPNVQMLYSLMNERANFLSTCGIPRKFIWTKNGLNSFFKTGKTGDHFPLFGALTKEECRETLKFVTKIKGVKYKILKNEYRVFDTEFVLCESKHVSIYDPIWGWWEGFSMAEISDKRMLRLLTDFYNNELWEKACYSEEESKQIIDKILGED